MSTHRRSWQQQQVGRAMITVALKPADGDLSFENHRRLAGFTAKLVDTFVAERLSATWAVADPGRSPLCAPIIRAAVEQEIAILGNDDWIGAQAGRTRFARELASRVAQSRSAGIQATSIVTQTAPAQEHMDLMVKQGITVVAGGQCSQGGRVQLATPRSLHFGVWDMPASARLPMPSTWFMSSRRMILRQIRTAAKTAGAFHLVIDAAAFEEESRGRLTTITRISRGIAELRDRGLLQVETLGQASMRLTAVPAAKPQRSILRRAA